VLAAAVATTVTDSSAEEVAFGQVYSTDRGDPLDVFVGQGDSPGMVCANVGAFFYGSGISCFALDDADDTGSYQVAIPGRRRSPPLVVGVMPATANSATVLVGNGRVESETRGRWFLAELELGALGPRNATPLTVDFD
jgi:hypothetical protein